MAVHQIALYVDDDALVRLSHTNPGFQLEREPDGTLSVSPTNTGTGAKSAEAVGQLRDYSKVYGGKAFDSSTGFAIGPGSAVRSPDASWVSQARINALSPQDREGFWPLSPDVVVELRSKSDAFAETVAAVDRFIDRGTAYAAAIDPETRQVVERGSPPAGLRLDFDAIIDA